MNDHLNEDILKREVVTETKVIFTSYNFDVDTDVIESDVFAIGFNKWMIELHPKYWSEVEKDNCFAITLRLNKSLKTRIKAKVLSFIMDCHSVKKYHSKTE